MPGQPVSCEIVPAAVSLLLLLCRWCQAAQVGNELPALLLRQAAPDGHAFVGIPILQQPGNLPIAGVADAIASETWSGAFAVCVSAVAFGAVFLEEVLSGSGGLSIAGIGIH